MLCGTKGPTDNPAEGALWDQSGGPGREAGPGCLEGGEGQDRQAPGVTCWGFTPSDPGTVLVLRSRWPSPVQFTLVFSSLLILFPS